VIESTECTACWGLGWIRNEHCPACDGTGEVTEDPWYIGADLLYDEMKDRQMEDCDG